MNFNPFNYFRNKRQPKALAGFSKEILEAYNNNRPLGPQKKLCLAPSRNMFFDQTGQVNACGWNNGHPLGKYPEQSVSEIWESSATQALRDSISNNDLSNGCQVCKHYLLAGNFSNIKSHHYDYLSENVGHPFPLRMDFALSNVCNLQCQTCYGELSSTIRKNREGLPQIQSVYDDAFVDQLRPFIPHLKAACFLGGEPFLVPIYYDIWNLFAELNGNANIAITTNATVLNDRVKNIMEACNFDIAVSRDAMDHTKLEKLRLGTNSRAQLDNIEFFNDYCKRKNKPFGLNAILSSLNWADLVDVIRYCNSIEAKIYVCTVMFPAQHSIRKMPVSDLTRIRDLYEKELSDLPTATEIEQLNKKALEGALREVIYAIEQTPFNTNSAENLTVELFLQKAAQFAKHVGADENKAVAMLQNALDRMSKDASKERFNHFIQLAHNPDEFELVMSHLIWRDEESIYNYRHLV